MEFNPNFLKNLFQLQNSDVCKIDGFDVTQEFVLGGGHFSEPVLLAAEEREEIEEFGAIEEQRDGTPLLSSEDVTV